MAGRVIICTLRGPFERGDESCPNVAAHTPWPVGYLPRAAWVEDALLVADQKKCSGCGDLVVWVPRRPDLRIATEWPPPTCDWGGCDGEGVAERFHPGAGEWVAVCRTHTGVDDTAEVG